MQVTRVHRSSPGWISSASRSWAFTASFTFLPNFFTASPLQLKIYCNLEDEQIEEVIAARNIWFKERTLIRDQLDPLLYASLSGLSWRESGTYTVTVGPQEKAERPSRRLVFTFERFDVTGASDNNVKFIEWMQF